MLFSYSQHSRVSLQVMSDEVDRVMKLIRDLRRLCCYYKTENEQQTANGDRARSKLTAINEMIGSILARFPAEYVPSSAEGKDDLTRLETGVTRLVEAVRKVSSQFDCICSF